MKKRRRKRFVEKKRVCEIKDVHSKRQWLLVRKLFSENRLPTELLNARARSMGMTQKDLEWMLFRIEVIYRIIRIARRWFAWSCILVYCVLVPALWMFGVLGSKELVSCEPEIIGFTLIPYALGCVVTATLCDADSRRRSEQLSSDLCKFVRGFNIQRFDTLGKMQERITRKLRSISAPGHNAYRANLAHIARSFGFNTPTPAELRMGPLAAETQELPIAA